MAGQPDGIDGPGGQGSGLTAVATYPRTITISRIPTDDDTGDLGYRSTAQQQEQPVAGLSDLMCEILFYTRGPDPLAKVPSDDVGRTLWNVYVPAGSVTPGAIQHSDIATDDLGRRFKLNEPYFGGIDISIMAELLRA